MFRKVLAGLACVFAGAQLIRFEHTNPPITGEVPAPAAVKDALRSACYDCHSNETSWPWSASLAPISWLVHYDVIEGRRRLNFSSWDAYTSDPGTQLQKLRNIEMALAEEDMPPWSYRLVHPGSKLSGAQQNAIVHWASEEITGLEASPQTREAD